MSKYKLFFIQINLEKNKRWPFSISGNGVTTAFLWGFQGSKMSKDKLLSIPVNPGKNKSSNPGVCQLESTRTLKYTQLNLGKTIVTSSTFE